MPFWGEEISADKHAVVALDGADVLLRLPVPEPELAVAVPGHDVAPAGAEPRLDGVPGAQVALVLLPTLLCPLWPALQSCPERARDAEGDQHLCCTIAAAPTV